eukprot:m51a1_g9416 putative glycoprotein endo-alpha- -mannosidase (1076) ;mRNA; r:352396-357808
MRRQRPSLRSCRPVWWLLSAVVLLILTTTLRLASKLEIGRGGLPVPPGAAGAPDDSHSKATRDVHVFYYPWYAEPSADGRWSHWNHRILPHWTPGTRDQYPHDVAYEPPDDIGSNFYPALGPYSSRNRTVVDRHMEDLRDYVVVVSWWGPRDAANAADGEGYTTDETMQLLLDSARAKGAKIAIHLEPYKGRNAQSVARDLEYIERVYGGHPALYRDPRRSNRFLVYVYDSYLTGNAEWAGILKPHSPNSIRGKRHDAVVLGLVLDQGAAGALVQQGGFDGVYNYFAADRFTWASTRENWPAITREVAGTDGLVSLSVGPGYIDTRIRPWNSANTRERDGGRYYTEGLAAALGARPTYLSITSYNEWHEGSQVEPAIPKTAAKSLYAQPPGTHACSSAPGAFCYLDYSPRSPRYYLELTQEHALRFARHLVQELGRCTVVIGPHAFPNVLWYSAPVGVLVFEFPDNPGAMWCALPWELEFERMAGGEDLQGQYTPLPEAFADPPFADLSAASELAARGPQRLFILRAPPRLQQFLRASDPAAAVGGTPPRAGQAQGPGQLAPPASMATPQQQAQLAGPTGTRWYSGLCEFWIEGQQLCHAAPPAPPEQLPQQQQQLQQQQQAACVSPPAGPWQSTAFQKIIAPAPQRADMSPIISPTSTTPVGQQQQQLMQMQLQGQQQQQQQLVACQQSPVVMPTPLPAMALPPMPVPLQPLTHHVPIQPHGYAPQQPQLLRHSQQGPFAAPGQQQQPQQPQHPLAQQMLLDAPQQGPRAQPDGIDRLAEAARLLDRALFSPSIDDDENAAESLLGVSSDKLLPSISAAGGFVEAAAAAVAAAHRHALPVSPRMPRRTRYSSDDGGGSPDDYTGSGDDDEDDDDDGSEDGDDYAPAGPDSPSKRRRMSNGSLRKKRVAQGSKTPMQGTRSETPTAPVCRWKGCGKVFERVSQLTSHLQTHTMSQSVHRCMWEGCSRTGKPFSNHSGLFRHLRYHTGDKPCKCTYGSCTFSSVDNGELRRHLKLVHRVEMLDPGSGSPARLGSTPHQQLEPPISSVPHLSLAPPQPPVMPQHALGIPLPPVLTPL